MIKPSFKRGHRDTTEITDRIIFFSAFLGGGAIILFIRWLGDYVYTDNGISAFDWSAIGIACVILTSYFAYILITKERSGVAVDRGSDNIYYIGLLFTLISLAYSLYKLSSGIDSGPVTDRSDKVLSLLPDFGIGLFSTILGMGFRTALQNMRDDSVDDETADIKTAARDELGDAIHQLRGRVGQVVADLNGLSAQMNVTLSEMTRGVAKTLEDTAHQNAEIIKSVTKNISGLDTKFNNLTAELDNSAEAIKKVMGDEKLGQLFTIISATEKNLGEIKQKVSDSENEMEATTSKLSTQLKNLISTNQTIEEHNKNIKSTVKSVDDAATEYVGELSKASKILKKETKKL